MPAFFPDLLDLEFATHSCPVPRGLLFLRWLLIVGGLCVGIQTATAAEDGGGEESVLSWASRPLRELQSREASLRSELAELGVPMVGQTVPQFGYQSRRLAAPPLTPPWIDIDLGERQNIDWIALVPAQVDWQAIERPAYGFPRRFRIDVADEAGFHEFRTVADYTDADFENPGVSPVAVHLSGVTARFVRLTVTKLAVENGQYFFALAEIMVLNGNRDIAIGCPVHPSVTFNLQPRWTAANLVDGWTPLGPPIRRELLPYDGLFADPPAGGHALPWMMLDLGSEVPIQEVRLHPVHARIGADVPGYLFPPLFQVQAGRDPEFSAPVTIFDTGEQPFPNPGNNPVILSGHGVLARYVRVQNRASVRFGLSEIQVYSDGVNVARKAIVTASADRSGFSNAWPKSLLVDGYTSYGRLMEWPEWLESWSRRSAIRHELAGIESARPVLIHEARRRVGWAAAAVLSAGLGGVGAALFLSWRRRKRELASLRVSLARDLHDEIGSNLAALAVLSEYALEGGEAQGNAREDWSEVNRIARETTDSMREVLWLMGGRGEAGIDLANHLDLAANRMLGGMEIYWRERLTVFPSSLATDARRQIFLFFKEALANVVRHSGATKVELTTALHDGQFRMIIADNGRGFAVEQAREGMGLRSLNERARSLGGRAMVESAPGMGTTITLFVPAT